MKFEDFSTPRFLIEQAEAEIRDDLEVIAKELDGAQKSDAGLVLQAKSLLQQMLNKARGILNKVHHDNHENGNIGPALTSINEDVTTYSMIHELEEEISQICIIVPNCDPIVGNLRAKISQLRVGIEGAFSREKAAGRAEAEKAGQEFMKSIDAALARLAEKIDGHAIQNYNNGDYTKSQINKMKTIEKNHQQLMALFDNLFRKKIKSGEVSQEEALKFANAAADGLVLDMSSLVNDPEGHGLIDSYVNPEYKKVYDVVIADLLVLMPAKTGGHAGPAEVALAALGNTSKQSDRKGDLVVDDVKYEVKGGSTPKNEAPTGGRLNGAKMSPGRHVHENFTKLLTKQHKNLLEQMQILFNKGEWKGKYLVSGLTASGIQNYERALNLTGYHKQQVIDLFHDLGSLLVLDYHDTVNSRVDQYYHDLLDSAISQSAQGIRISYEGIQKAITFVQHESYKKSDKFDRILLINKSSRSFAIISSGEDFVNKMNDGKVVVTNGLAINATDPQSATFHFTSK